jgi:hypothetical protein
MTKNDIMWFNVLPRTENTLDGVLMVNPTNPPPTKNLNQSDNIYHHHHHHHYKNYTHI